jgi:excisionase family DNA binding protein
MTIGFIAGQEKGKTTMTSIPGTSNEIISSDDNPASLSESQPLWTVKDTAEYLRLKPETVRMMARKGDLPAIKVGKRVWRFRPGDVENWLNSHK